MFSFSGIAKQVREKGFAEFEFRDEDVKAPRPFWRPQGDKDSFDFMDMHAPLNQGVEQPSPEFVRLAEEMAITPFPVIGMDPITTDCGIRKRLLEEGITTSKEGEVLKAKEGYRVWIHYDIFAEIKGSLKLLDSTRKHELATSLELGSDGIPGLQMAIQSMKKGEIAEFAIKPEYGYGTMGIPHFITGDTPIRVIIELMDVSTRSRKSAAFLNEMEKQTMMRDYTIEEILIDVEQVAVAGKKKFQLELYREAVDRYSWATSILKDYLLSRMHDHPVFGLWIDSPGTFDRDLESIEKQWFRFYSNIAQCCIRLEDYQEAERICEKALQLDCHDENLKPKVLYRYAVALLHLKKFEKALETCKRGLRMTWGHAQFRSLEYNVSSPSQ